MQGEAPVRTGDVLAGKYRVDRVLGVGGMGVVVSATHLQLEQRVALKFMLPAAFANPEALGRFQREARAAVKLKSEHVARVLDTGTFDDGSPYIIMEYLEGTDLSAEIARTGSMPLAVVAEYIVQAPTARRARSMPTAPCRAGASTTKGNSATGAQSTPMSRCP